MIEDDHICCLFKTSKLAVGAEVVEVDWRAHILPKSWEISSIDLKSSAVAAVSENTLCPLSLDSNAAGAMSLDLNAVIDASGLPWFAAFQGSLIWPGF